MTATPEQCHEVLKALGLSAGIFGGILAFLWAADRFILQRWRKTPSCAAQRSIGWGLFEDTLVWALPITLGTLMVSLLCSAVAEACGLELPKQQLVLMLQPGFFPDYVRAAIAAFALFEAPLLEEGIFRRFLFRNLLKKDGGGFWLAASISGALFALAHFNKLTFLPLWFFGLAMAWAYHRTGRLIVPMMIHFLFNLTNLLLIFIFPEMP